MTIQIVDYWTDIPTRVNTGPLYSTFAPSVTTWYQPNQLCRQAQNQPQIKVIMAGNLICYDIVIIYSRCDTSNKTRNAIATKRVGNRESNFPHSVIFHNVPRKAEFCWIYLKETCFWLFWGSIAVQWLMPGLRQITEKWLEHFISRCRPMSIPRHPRHPSLSIRDVMRWPSSTKNTWQSRASSRQPFLLTNVPSKNRSPSSSGSSTTFERARKKSSFMRLYSCSRSRPKLNRTCEVGELW